MMNSRDQSGRVLSATGNPVRSVRDLSCFLPVGSLWCIADGFTRSPLLARALLFDRCQQSVQFERDDAIEFLSQDRADFGNPFVFAEDEAMSAFDRSYRWFGNSCSPHADQVDGADFRVIAAAGEHDGRQQEGEDPGISIPHHFKSPFNRAQLGHLRHDSGRMTEA